MEIKILIAYYSWSGNTKELANYIKKEVGGDLFEIVPEKSYPDLYQLVVEQAKKEIKEGYKPPLKYKLESIDFYNIVFIGTPNWWSTVAPPVATFLTLYDFSNKIIIPFGSHGGGGKGKIESDIKRLCPQSNVLEGFFIYEDDFKDIEKRISDFLRKINIKR